MDFKSYLDETALLLDKEIRNILDEWEEEMVKISPNLIPLAKAFIKSCQGGKGIRGTLVRLGYALVNKESKEIIKVGAAYEILHTALLIHDDIIDQSATRRGQPSLYKAVGEQQAITLGDLGFFLAIKIISESKFEDKKKNQALNLFAKTMIDTAIGQILDIQKGDPELVARLKTARYSISGPLKLGAILGGAKLDQLAILDKFGDNLGIAFQIRDDILDGEALDYSRQMGVEYVMRAKLVIPKLTKDKNKKKLLTEMAEFLFNREL